MQAWQQAIHQHIDMFVQVFALGGEIRARERQTNAAFTVGTVTQGTGRGVNLLTFFHGLIETGERCQSGRMRLFLSLRRSSHGIPPGHHFHGNWHEGVVLANKSAH